MLITIFKAMLACGAQITRMFHITYTHLLFLLTMHVCFFKKRIFLYMVFKFGTTIDNGVYMTMKVMDCQYNSSMAPL